MTAFPGEFGWDTFFIAIDLLALAALAWWLVKRGRP